MADVAELRRLAEAAREFEVQAQGVTLRLRLPTVLQLRRLVNANAPASVASRDALSHVQEPLLRECLCGWRGVPADAVAPGAEGELPFDARLAEAVLDRYPQAADAAFRELIERYGERRERFEAAEKNS